MWAFLLSALTAAATSGENSVVCRPRELARQDCRLQIAPYNIRLLAETVAWHDGTWYTVDPIPLKNASWEKIQFSRLGGRPVLQFWLWDAGTDGVQALHWYVADAEKRKFQVLAEGIVRRRRARHKPDEKPTDKITFIYDAIEKHSLKAGANGRLIWQLGSQRRELER